jgi:large subunit ribosomal protein L40
VHEAWAVLARRQRRQRRDELARQCGAMRAACEALRALGDDGVVGGEGAGRRFREAMNKTGVWDAGAVPVEYARCLTDWPSRQGWDHAWKRG